MNSLVESILWETTVWWQRRHCNTAVGVMVVSWGDDVPRHDCLCGNDDAHPPPLLLSLLSSFGPHCLHRHLASLLPCGVIITIVAIVANIAIPFYPCHHCPCLRHCSPCCCCQLGLVVFVAVWHHCCFYRHCSCCCRHCHQPFCPSYHRPCCRCHCPRCHCLHCPCHCRSLVPSWLLCSLSPSSIKEVSVITLVTLALVALAFFCCPCCRCLHCPCHCHLRCLLSATIARPMAARLSSADGGAAAASCPTVEPLLPLVAPYFIMADCYIIALAPAPSSHCCSHCHCCHCIVIVSRTATLMEEFIQKEKRQEKSIFNCGTKGEVQSLDWSF